MSFDFKKHKIDAIGDYVKFRPIYELYANSIKEILIRALSEKRTNYHSIESRAKDLESFGKKASKESETNPSEPKYLHPLKEITDLSGVRVIVFFPKTVEEIDTAIDEQFEVIEKSDKSEILWKQEKLGYQSVHYLIKLKSNRTELPEYQSFAKLVAEIQVRTILQHAWAEIEHDIKYKSTITIPISIRRRFIALAGLLEIADREFQSIQDDDKKLKTSDRKSVREGKLEDVIITPDSLRAYLDKTLGADGRIGHWSYHLGSETLLKIGFKNLRQVDDCVSKYVDNPVVDTVIWGNRQGQIWRFEGYVLAGLGEQFIKRHPRVIENKWWENKYTEGLKVMEERGIEVGTYMLKG